MSGIAQPIFRPIYGPIAQAIYAARVGGGAAPFSPASLFASGEQGAWYDRSILASMFQDAAGTTAITAVTQPVGLVLDQRIPPGPEVVVNGNFATGDMTGWTKSGATGTAVVSGGQATLTFDGGGAMIYQQSITVPVGVWVQVRGNVVSSTSATLRLKMGSTGFGAADYLQLTAVGNGAATVFTTSSTLYVSMGSYSAGSTTFSGFSAHLLGGNVAIQSGSTLRPLLALSGSSYYLHNDGVNDVMGTLFPSLGSNVTIARSLPASGASILTGQTIGAGTWNDSTDSCALIIVNRALTGAETTGLTAWLNNKAGFF